MRAEPAQAPHDLGDVAAEDAAVDVGLVEHHVAELVKELRPALVCGKDADVQHVGIAEDDRRRATQLGALLVRRVAVVDRRDDAGDAHLGQLAGLVLGERLGGEEEEGACLRLRGEGFEDGELVAEALAARRSGAHDQVLAGRERIPGGDLMAVERVHAGGEERVAQRGWQVLRKLDRAAPPRRLVRHGHDLLVAAAGEERPQRGGRLGSHAGVIHRFILPRRAAPASACGGFGRPCPIDLRNAKGALARPSAQPSVLLALRAMRRPASSVKNHTVPS